MKFSRIEYIPKRVGTSNLYLKRAYLPKNLIKKLEEIYPKEYDASAHWSIKILKRILEQLYFKVDKQLDSFVHIPHEYVRRIAKKPSRLKPTWIYMRENGIFEQGRGRSKIGKSLEDSIITNPKENDPFIGGWRTGKSYVFRINPELLMDEEFEWVFYEDTEHKERRKLKPLERAVLNLQGQLHLDTEIVNDIERVISEEAVVQEKHLLNELNLGISSIAQQAGTRKEEIELIRGKVERSKHLNTIRLVQWGQDPSVEVNNPKISGTNGRLNHLLSYTPKRLIKYLRIGGERLKEIDLRCAQFCLFSNILINPQIVVLEDKPELIYFGQYVHDMAWKLFEGGGPSAATKLKSERVKTKDESVAYMNSYPLDIQRFIIASIKGTLYDDIGLHLLGERYISKEHRDMIKTECFSIFYGKYLSESVQRSGKLGTLRVSIWDNYPNLMSWINDFKNHMADIYRHTNDKSLLAMTKTRKAVDPKTGKYIEKSALKAGSDYFSIALQKVESSIFINDILPILYDSGIRALPKHDAILCPESDLEGAHEIILNRLAYLLGKGRFALNVA